MNGSPDNSPDPQFDRIAVSELFCSRCGRAQPVRRHLLLVLPGGNKYEFRCSVCGQSVGSEDASSNDFDLLKP